MDVAFHDKPQPTPQAQAGANCEHPPTRTSPNSSFLIPNPFPICVNLRHLRINYPPSDGVNSHPLSPAPAGLNSDRTDPSRENGQPPSTTVSPIRVRSRLPRPPQINNSRSPPSPPEAARHAALCQVIPISQSQILFCLLLILGSTSSIRLRYDIFGSRIQARKMILPLPWYVSRNRIRSIGGESRLEHHSPPARDHEHPIPYFAYFQS